jgi:tryptophanyl-tRNA synthetase
LRAEVAQACRRAEIGCVDCKKRLFEHMRRELDPIRERARDLRTRPDDVTGFLAESASACKAIAAETMDEVRRRMGIRGPRP